MKAKIILTLITVGLIISAFSQKATMELTFTAENNSQHVPLDSILIENLTMNADTTLYAPDTLLLLDYITAIENNQIFSKNNFSVSQNYPNPFIDQTSIQIYMPQDDNLTIAVYNLLGKQVASFNGNLNTGLNTFNFYPGNEKCYLFTAIWQDNVEAIKMFNINPEPNKKCSIIWKGLKPGAGTHYKQKALPEGFQNNTFKFNTPAAITIDPPNATANDELTLSFDPTKACSENGSLVGLPSIAMHSGVTTFSGGNWQYEVPYNGQGANGQSTTLLPTGDGKYSITFTPAEFYGVNADEVTHICAVFNNGTNWDQDGRDSIPGSLDCMDFFIPLHLTHFVFSPGNELRYTGYAKTVNGVPGSDVIEDAPQANETYELDISEGIPCPGTPFVNYEGKLYNTVKIGSQCWMKENLNLGVKIDGIYDQVNNGLFEKYCYDDLDSNCDTYGGLYQWDEMMQYTNTLGGQGICPVGWHIPTDEEWKQLEGAVDSQYGYPDPEWNNEGWRGFDAGLNLKSTFGWNANGNGVDLFGFQMIPGGYRDSDGSFVNLFHSTALWTTSEASASYASNRYLNFEMNSVSKANYNKYSGYSVRCIKGKGFSCGDSFIDDRDGQSYTTVQIDEQCWMSENLNVGSEIYYPINPSNNGIIEKYCYLDDDSYCDIYGGLYGWNEMMKYTIIGGTQGICPDQWHIPTDSEWIILTNFLGGESVAGGKMKETGFVHWNSPNTGATNESGFTALPGGYAHWDNGYYFLGIRAYFWTSTEYFSQTWVKQLSYNVENVVTYEQYIFNNFRYFSVRCLRD